MKLLNVIDEDIVNYKKISMYIAFPHCSMKCNIDAKQRVCQNASLLNKETINVNIDELVERYLANPITKAIVMGGLEPFDSQFDLVPFIHTLRTKYNCEDDVVIYTGYTEEELEGLHNYNYTTGVLQVVAKDMYTQLKNYKNIIIKFGRYIPSDETHMDPILGVQLASNNQYAKVISNI